MLPKIEKNVKIVISGRIRQRSYIDLPNLIKIWFKSLLLFWYVTN